MINYSLLIYLECFIEVLCPHIFIILEILFAYK